MNASVIPLPSTTALMSAAARAAHPLVDAHPLLLLDEQAAALCGSVPGSPLTYQLLAPDEPVLAAARLSATARSRFAEDAVRRSGADQHVVLGAGLDTSAHRLAAHAATWLVDLPGVLLWRAGLFGATGLPDVGTPVPLDLAAGDLPAALARAGCDLARPVAVSWLGGTMYLDPAEVERVLGALAGLAAGSRIVLDHLLPPDERDEAGRAYGRAVSVLAGTAAEPWRSTPSATDLGALLERTGWSVEVALDEADAVPDGFWDRGDALRRQRLVRFVQARR